MGLFHADGSARHPFNTGPEDYATFQLTEGVDVYFLAMQMATSVKMIEDHYSHVTPVKNADRILQGLPSWVPIASAPQEARW